MRFLSGVDIQANVKQLVSRSGNVMAAVAYWGQGAAQRTGLAGNDQPKSVRVICDLLSGACNPAEVEKLMSLGIMVKTLDRLHAKVWIGGNDVIVGSANASHNGLPGDDEEAANASIEAAVLSHDPRLARQLTVWFEEQWRASEEIEKRHFDQARDLWSRRHRSGGRGFTTPLTDKIRNPDPLDRFADLRLLAYPRTVVNREAVEFVQENAPSYFTDEERREFGNACPWYEWPHTVPEWKHPPGTVFADFTCELGAGTFTFNGFWQVRDCPAIELEEVRLTLLTKLPHFNGYSISPTEQQRIARRVGDVVAARNHRKDDFGSYIDKSFPEFYDAERVELRRWLLARVVQVAQELCRSGQFAPALTLQAIRACKKDSEWLAGYTRFVGGDIYSTRNPLKRKINPDFGRRIKAGVGAEDRIDDGSPVRKTVENEIIRSYTLFAKYDPQAVGNS